MIQFESNPKVLQWNCESVIIPYIKPTDGKLHRYFVDFWVKYQEEDGKITEYLIEVKPSKECVAPEIKSKISGSNNPTRSTRYRNANLKFLINQAKWEAASKFAEKNGMIFKIFTEKTLGIKPLPRKARKKPKLKFHRKIIVDFDTK